MSQCLNGLLYARMYDCLSVCLSDGMYVRLSVALTTNLTACRPADRLRPTAWNGCGASTDPASASAGRWRPAGPTLSSPVGRTTSNSSRLRNRQGQRRDAAQGNKTTRRRTRVKAARKRSGFLVSGRMGQVFALHAQPHGRHARVLGVRSGVGAGRRSPFVFWHSGNETR